MIFITSTRSTALRFWTAEIITSKQSNRRISLFLMFSPRALVLMKDQGLKSDG